MSNAYKSWKFHEDDEIADGRSVIQLLGGGVRAEAWLAWDQLLHTVVVVKILRPDHVDDEHELAALAREAQALRDLPHPAIVRLFDAQLTGPRPHLVLENLDGPRLSTLVHNFGPLSPEQLVPLGLEISSALAFMHNRGFVHLDLKPRNLIMSATPKMIDLGMVRNRQQLARLREPIGTRAYMAPEQCAPETVASSGPPADVWGLGVTMYEAAEGRPAFELDPAGPLYPQLTTRPEPLSRHIPAPVSQLIYACLDPHAEGRPSAVELATALEGLLADSRKVARGRLSARFRR